jgi:hypothetical protein
MSLEVVLGLAVAVYALYYLCFVGKEPEVHHCPRDGSRAARLARDLPILREKFWPTPGLDNTHLQTLLGASTASPCACARVCVCVCACMCVRACAVWRKS